MTYMIWSDIIATSTLMIKARDSFVIVVIVVVVVVSLYD